MGRYLEALNDGTPFDSILATLRDASPLAGGTFEEVDDTLAMSTQAESWLPGEPAYEEALDDMAEALAADLISPAEYDEAFVLITG